MCNYEPEVTMLYMESKKTMKNLLKENLELKDQMKALKKMISTKYPAEITNEATTPDAILQSYMPEGHMTTQICTKITKN